MVPLEHLLYLGALLFSAGIFVAITKRNAIMVLLGIEMMENAGTYYPTFIDATLALAILLPLCSFLVSMLISDRYAWTISLVAPLFLLVSTVCSFITFFNVWGNVPYATSVDWFHSGEATFKAGVLMNDIS